MRIESHGLPFLALRSPLGMALLLIAWGARAANTESPISSVPLFLGNAQPPNVILGVDDSQSMNADVVMANYNEGYYKGSASLSGLFPDAFSIGSGEPAKSANLQYIPPLPEFADARSPAFNTLYFDPGVDYEPWADYNLAFDNVNPSATPWDPVKTLVPYSATYRPGMNCTLPVAGFPNVFKLDTDIKCYGSGYTFNANGDALIGVSANGSGYPLDANGDKPAPLPAYATLPAGTEYLTRPGIAGVITSSAIPLRANLAFGNKSQAGISYYPATFYLPENINIQTTYPKYFSRYVGNGDIVQGLNSANTAMVDLYWDLDDNSGNSYLDKTAWGLSGQTRTKLRKYEIKCDTAHFSDLNQCAAAIRNFGNWFTYYRKRSLAARGAMGLAFEHIKGMNLGIFRINSRPSNLNLSSLNNVSDHNAIFTNTGSPNPGIYYYSFTGGTPNRQAIDYMGQQFQKAGKVLYSCQKNAGILFTDGVLTDNNVTIPGIGNVDGQTLVSDDGKTIFSGIAPYKDGISDTMADIAMKYYADFDSNTPGLTPGKVPVPPACGKPNAPKDLDCNKNLHMNFYAVSLGVPGKLFKPDNPSDPYDDGHTPAWPEPPTRIADFTTADKQDDLWHATINGRGKLFSAKNPLDIRDKMTEIINSIAAKSGSASSVATTSVYLSTDTLVFLAGFDSSNWSGDVYAFKFAGGNLSALAWRASEKISGETYAYRQQHIFTYNPENSGCDGGAGKRGINFEWESLSCDQRDHLNTDPLNQPSPITDNLGPDRVAYIQGNTAKEMRNGGPFRDRTDATGNEEQILGDFVNSNPSFSGSQDFGYGLLPGGEGSGYGDYLANEKASRAPMLYIGGNDGMLHAFNASSGPSGGEDVFGYVPSTAYENLSRLTSPGYTETQDKHRFFVDGSPWVGDAFLGSGWKTILLGATGAGGRGIFALDISHPNTFGARDVMWEFSTTNDTDLPDLGFTLPQPLLVRTNDESHPWVAIVANGYYSKNGHAVLFILDLNDGSILRRFDTQAGGNTWMDKNGLSTPIAIDANQDRKADYVYAGDLVGNLWKFDLSDPRMENWKVAFEIDGKPGPLFVACQNNAATCADADRQPITGKPQVGLAQGQLSGFMVYFGTGRYFASGDQDPASQISQQLQSLYGIWDTNEYAGTTLSAPPVARAKLAEQTIINETAIGLYTARFTSSNPVDYGTQQGWYLNLVLAGNSAQGERSISDPALHDGKITFTTFSPTSVPCTFGGNGWIMEFDAFTGGAPSFKSPLFDVNKDNAVDSKDLANGAAPTGLAFNAIPSSTRIVRDGSQIYRITNTSAGVTDGAANAEVQKGNSPVTSGRQSWRQLH